MLAAWLREAYIKEGYEKGYARGYAEGYAQGRAEVRAERYAAGRAEIRAIALAELRKMEPGVSAAEAIRRLEIAFEEAERRRQSAA